jgi:hypothetical protein
MHELTVDAIVVIVIGLLYLFVVTYLKNLIQNGIGGYIAPNQLVKIM